MFGTLTVRVTFVAPEPAGTVEGENVAVVPTGNPVTVNVSGAPTVGGETASTKFAWPPGETVAEDDPPLGVPIV